MEVADREVDSCVVSSIVNGSRFSRIPRRCRLMISLHPTHDKIDINQYCINAKPPPLVKNTMVAICKANITANAPAPSRIINVMMGVRVHPDRPASICLRRVKYKIDACKDRAIAPYIMTGGRGMFSKHAELKCTSWEKAAQSIANASTSAARKHVNPIMMARF